MQLTFLSYKYDIQTQWRQDCFFPHLKQYEYEYVYECMVGTNYFSEGILRVLVISMIF